MAVSLKECPNNSSSRFRSHALSRFVHLRELCESHPIRSVELASTCINTLQELAETNSIPPLMQKLFAWAAQDLDEVTFRPIGNTHHQISFNQLNGRVSYFDWDEVLEEQEDNLRETIKSIHSQIAKRKSNKRLLEDKVQELKEFLEKNQHYHVEQETSCTCLQQQITSAKEMLELELLSAADTRERTQELQEEHDSKIQQFTAIKNDLTLSKNDVQRLRNEVNEMMENNGKPRDTILHRDALRNRVQALTSALEETEQRYDEKIQSYASLLVQIKQKTEELERTKNKRIELLHEREQHLRCHTPRPQWISLADKVLELEQFIDKSILSRKLSLSQSNQTQSKDSPSNKDEEKAVNSVGSRAGVFGQYKCKETTKSTITIVNFLTEKIEKANMLPTNTADNLIHMRQNLQNLTRELDATNQLLLELASKQPRTQHQVSSKQQSVKYFTGLGTTPNIKPYLRFNGNIRNRNMTKVELLTIIREVWAKKQERDKTKGKLPMDEFFYEHLKNKFGIQPVIAKWGYNIVHALQIHQSESPEIQLFMNILDGELSEEVYYDQLRMIEQLREFLKRINMMSMGKISGRIHKYDLFSNLSRIFPLKDETALNDLKYSLTKEQRSGMVDYNELLDTNTEGPFLSMLRTQHVKDVKQLQKRIEREVMMKDATGRGRVLLTDIRAILEHIDKDMTQDTLFDHISRGLKCKRDELEKEWFSESQESSMRFINRDEFLHNLFSGLVRPSRLYVTDAQPVLGERTAEVTATPPKVENQAKKKWNLAKTRLRGLSLFAGNTNSEKRETSTDGKESL